MKGLALGQYTKCRMHGGASTGPRTPEGRERCRKANWKYGKYSAATKAERRKFRRSVQQMRLEVDRIARQMDVVERKRNQQQRAEENVPIAAGSFVSGMPTTTGAETGYIFDEDVAAGRRLLAFYEAAINSRANRCLSALKTATARPLKESNGKAFASLMNVETRLLARLARFCGLY